MIEIIKAIIFGIVEGITEWLPISSTGHLILFEKIFAFKNVSEGFWSMFEVVIQLGAILAVVVLFWNSIFPFTNKNGRGFKESGILSHLDKEITTLWFKIIVACIPAVIFVVLGLDDVCEAMFYNYFCVAIALIVFGVAFIVVENWNKGRRPVITTVAEIGYNSAIIIGLFQLLAAIVPGTSRSGATILGALLIGISRGVAAEYTFYLAIPVMLGASLLKIIKGGFGFGVMGTVTLTVGMVVAFVVSLFVIKFLLGYIRKHDFKAFGYYRIVLGVIVLLYFFISGAQAV